MLHALLGLKGDCSSDVKFPELKRCLIEQLAGPLPGPEAQLGLAPRPRFGWRPGHIPDEARHSGVLLLLFPVREVPHFVLTVRDRRLPQHAGQVSLPGGAVEGDESPRETALREAREEIGVDPRSVAILGRLSPLHVPVSGFVLHPLVGTTDAAPALVSQQGEVEQILDVSLDRLSDPSILRVEQRVHDGRKTEVPYFALEQHRVWGATAMVLAEFLTLLGTAPDPWR